MELTFDELKKRDVINVADGRCLGNVVDLRLSFPKGVLLGIYVPGRRKSGIWHLFDKSVIYISEKRIIKIGGDVILVNLSLSEEKPTKPQCPPPCSPQCPPPCPPKHPTCSTSVNIGDEDFGIFGNMGDRINTDDY